MLWSGWSRFFFWFPISQNLFSRPLVTIPSAPTAISITVTFKFYSFLNSKIKSNYYYYYYLEFFPHTPIDGFSQEILWQQVFSGLQDDFDSWEMFQQPHQWFDITVTFKFHSFLSSRARSKYFSSVLFSFTVTAICWYSKIYNGTCRVG